VARRTVLPSDTDSEIRANSPAHLVLFRPEAKPGKLLLFLPGTGGVPVAGPQNFFDAALRQGYSVIALSYINTPAVAQVCWGPELQADPDCAQKFRAQRLFGTMHTPLIADGAHDAIVHRLVSLLQYLAAHDSAERWGAYLEQNEPAWDRISVSGQSQGGGMAAFLAKTTPVHRVLVFSGGWDFAAPNTLAHWYEAPSVTPPERWYGAYSQGESHARTIAASYRAMAIPSDHIQQWPALPFADDNRQHGDGIGNAAHQGAWAEMLGDGS